MLTSITLITVDAIKITSIRYINKFSEKKKLPPPNAVLFILTAVVVLTKSENVKPDMEIQGVRPEVKKYLIETAIELQSNKK